MNWIQLVSGAIGSVGFGLIFNLRRKYLFFAALGGWIGWFVYLVCSEYVWKDEFLPMLAAGFAVAIYAEIMARICKAPSTLFFVTGAVPLIPGSSLYYCIYSLVTEEMQDAQQYGVQTLLCAAAIAAGMSIAWTICDFSRKIQGHIHKKHL